ncbi:hypothetical protein Vadar_025349 [Vaccinium darrowii]|uniref:Uncharacterized protein n=1 Tax=Vaccinium darrowii TaxID=229202 RepID=A0ACB7YYH9_9ERIC|nr:hypothetical protein Vadar_025349 [Vaccinium darrowii]
MNWMPGPVMNWTCDEGDELYDGKKMKFISDEQKTESQVREQDMILFQFQKSDVGVRYIWDFLVHRLLSRSLESRCSHQLCQREMHSSGKGQQEACDNHHGTCAICLSKIVLEEAALVKGCEHAYWPKI